MNAEFVLQILRAVAVFAPLIGAGIRAVIHLTGADEHKTVAGEIADHLNQAGDAAKQYLDGVQPGVQHGDPSRDPPA